MKMEIKTTIYDIFGYIIPGLGFLVAAAVAHKHSQLCNQPIIEVREFIVTMPNMEITVTLILAYLIGHFLSSLSAFIFEDAFSKFTGLAWLKQNDKILGEKMYEPFKKKFEETFDCEPRQKDFHACASYVEAKQPAVYATALIFQSFYGMARNLTLILMAYLVWELVNWLVFKNSQSAQYLLLALPAGLVCFYHYLRFFRYYRQHILTGFIVPADDRAK